MTQGFCRVFFKKFFSEVNNFSQRSLPSKVQKLSMKKETKQIPVTEKLYSMSRSL